MQRKLVLTLILGALNLDDESIKKDIDEEKSLEKSKLLFLEHRLVCTRQMLQDIRRPLVQEVLLWH